MYTRWLALLLLLLTSCASMTTPGEVIPITAPGADLPDLGLAPELKNTVWLNTPIPLHMADLRGKVVALDMWTFG